MRALPSSDSLRVLDSLDGYRASFMDADLWDPWIRTVCARHGYACTAIRPGLAGSFPTFIIDQQVVLKFLGQRFDGSACWRVEVEAAELVKGLRQLPASRLLASGRLPGSAGWRYLVYGYIPGVSFGEARRRVSEADKLALARWLGGSLREVHALRPSATTSLPRLTRRKLASWFASRKRGGLPDWPRHLARQADDYLAAAGRGAGTLACHVIHGDLTADHVLGEMRRGRWKTRGVIDFGDAMLANVFYELCALHLDLFAADKRLLSAFLETYRLAPDDRQDFAGKAMRTCILHRFDVLGPVFARQPRLRRLGSLGEVADALWNVATA